MQTLQSKLAFSYVAKSEGSMSLNEIEAIYKGLVEYQDSPDKEAEMSYDRIKKLNKEVRNWKKVIDWVKMYRYPEDNSRIMKSTINKIIQSI
jgi:hypothetical protein